MFRDIVLQDTRAEEWPAIRQRVSARVAASMGKPPDVDVAPDHEVVKEYERYGLRHQKIRYRVMPDEDGLAVIVLPEGIGKGRRAHAVVVCHGTYGGQLGKDGPLSMEGPERGYAIELARRGFVTLTPDNYEFGERLTRGEDMPTAEVTRRYVQSMVRFLEQHPEWSLDGRRLWDHQRLLDVLDGLPFIQPRAYGVMGHSLGGRTAAFLAALDERIAVAVPSCGMSPNLTNVYRVASGHPAAKASPEWIAYFQRTGGHMLYDYQDMIALCAPRPLLIVEPYNDAYNPYIEANFQCYAAGQRVYELLGKPECFRSLTHGDGHDTVDDVREFAYAWIKRWLRAG